MESAEPLPREYLISQGECCGSMCTNCPYTPKHKKGTKELNDNG